MLPLTTNNVNSYLIGISSDQTSLNQLASDLSSNFLGALTSRWTLAPWQTAQVNGLDPLQKSMIASVFQTSVNNRQLHPDNPMEAAVFGIPNAPSSVAEPNRVTAEGDGTVDSTGKWTASAKVTVSIC